MTTIHTATRDIELPDIEYTFHKGIPLPSRTGTRNGVHRLVIDDATVERAARALQELEGYGWLSMTAEIHMKKARAVLAAAVKEDGDE